MRNDVELGNGFRIADESESGTALDHLVHILTRFVRQIAQDGENGDAGQDARAAVCEADDGRISLKDK